MKAPLTTLFKAQKLGILQAKKVKVEGELSFSKINGQALIIPVEIRLKGFSSLNTCKFPKMELKFISKPTSGPFAGMKSVDLNTHCAEADDTSVNQHFRASVFAHREALAYRMLDILNMPGLRARAAFVKYVDTDSPSEIIAKAGHAYQAFFLEDMGDFKSRLAVKELKGFDDPFKKIEVMLDPKKEKDFQFHDVQSAPQVDAEDAARIALFQYMIANGDWFVKINPTHQRSATDKSNLWNVKAVQTKTDQWILFPQDFSLSGVLIGQVGSIFSQQIFEVVSLDKREKIKQTFRDRKAALLQLTSEISYDPQGQISIKSQLENFFQQLDQL